MAVYDKASSTYDQWYNEPMGAFVDKMETELILKMLPLQKGVKHKILDVGCGTGNFSIKLAEMGFDVVGIDISNEMLKIARKKAQQQNLEIDFIQMDIVNNTLINDSFDLVISVTAFEFMHDIKNAFHKMYSLVKERGYIMVGTINKESAWGELYKSREFQENSIFKYANLLTQKDLYNLNSVSLLSIDETLFTIPNANEKTLGVDSEKKYYKKNRGGFICALWQK